MTGKSLTIFVALVAAQGLGSTGHAQDGPPATAPRERTGSQADPLQAPPFAQPRTAAPDLPSVVAPPPAAADQTLARLDDVQVSTEGSGAALARSDWTPGMDPQSGLKLVHAPGQALDGSWLREQFATNGLIGQETEYGRIVALVQLINRAYLQNGYNNSGVLIGDSGVPGRLLLRLILGHVGMGGVTFDWYQGHSRGLSRSYVLDRMPALRAVPFNVNALEHDFRLLAEDAAIATIDASLHPGSHPGEAGLSLSVAPQRRFDLYLTAANNRSPSVGSQREAIGGSIRNVLGSGDLLSGEFGYTKGVTDLTLGYTGPILDTHTTVILRGSYNDAAVVESTLAPLDIKAREWSIEGGLGRKLLDEPLLPKPGGGWSAARSLTAGFLVGHKKSRTWLLGMPFSFSPGAVDGRAEYTVLRLTQDYVERGPGHALVVSLTETIGLDGTRSATSGSLTPPRNFAAVLAQASFARRLGAGWDLRARFSGQYTNSTLYSGERISFGGENSVRGYRENLLLADRGLFGSLEIGYSFSLSGKKATGGFDWGAFRIGAFIDGAVADNVRNPDPLPRSIASVGTSLGWRPSDGLSLRVAYAKSLRDPTIIGERHLQDRGVQFSLTIRPIDLFVDHR